MVIFFDVLAIVLGLLSVLLNALITVRNMHYHDREAWKAIYKSESEVFGNERN